MITEFPGYKIGALRFIDPQISLNERIAVSGSCEDVDNVVQLWLCQETLEVVSQQSFEGDVHAICPLPGNMISFTSSNGSVYIYHRRGHQLEQILKTETSTLPVNDITFNEKLRTIVSCGEDGRLAFFNFDSLTTKPTIIDLSSTPLMTVDSLSESAIICGNTSGHLKVVDVRNEKTVMSLPNGLTGLTVVRRNPSNPHVVITGNQLGTLCVWDLRKSGSNMGELAGHGSAVTELQFFENGKFTITSSLDGQLLKWSMSTLGQLDNVEAIVRPMSLSGPAITCFDLHSASDSIIFGNDKHVLSLINI